MGRIIAKRVKGMNWMAKISIMLVFTMIFSTFMYQGWYDPKLALATTDTYTTSTTWTAPAGVFSVTVEVWGGGGGGGGAATNATGSGSGGGGGAYSKKINIPVTPLTGYTVVVGVAGTGGVGVSGTAGGDSYFIDAATVMAKGGGGGALDSGAAGTGGSAAAGVGDAGSKFSGGNGIAGVSGGQSGGGGSSAGTAANGNNAASYLGAAAVAGGGPGGNGLNNVDGNGSAPVSGPGGAGGGGRSTANPNRNGGAGFAGQVSITYTANNAPTVSISDPGGSVAQGGTYTVTTYTLSDTEDVATAAFYYDTDAAGYNGTAMTGTCSNAGEGAGATCTWTVPGALAPGNYYIYAVANDGVNPAVNSAYNAAAITVTLGGNTLLHNSAITSSSKWPGNGGWGLAGTKYGEFVCATCHEPRATNIKGVKSTITAPVGSFPGSSVNFQSTTSPNGFGNDSIIDGTNTETPTRATSTKVCEVCHTYDAASTSGTKAHPNTTTATLGNHYVADNTDCTVCHKHNKGFDASCTDCHGNPPTTAGAGGPTGLANNPGATGSTTEGKHDTHVTTLKFVCTNCHYGYSATMAETPLQTIDIGFSMFTKDGSGTTYKGHTQVTAADGYRGRNTTNVSTVDDSRSCNNLYCHGAFSGGLTASPTWTTTSTAACGTCHANTAASATSLRASHIRHAGNAAGGLSVLCADCHGSHIVQDTHVNGSVVWSLNTGDNRFGAGAQYNSAASNQTFAVAPSATYQNCSNVYCHSNVQSSNGTAAASVYNSVQWGSGALTCASSCHNNDPGTGTHTPHTVAGYSCSNCHSGAGDETTLHANYSIDVAAGLNYTAGGAPANGYGTCSTIYCHSSGKGTYLTPSWGGVASGCNGCHGTSNTAGTPDYANAGAGVANANSHTKHTGAGTPTCVYCHSTTTTTGTTITGAVHIDNNLDVVQGGGKTFSWVGGVGNKDCSNISCHGTGSPSIKWGATTTCISCHGGNAASGSAITLPAHTPHMNNTTIIGTNYACAECHNTTVSASSDAVITGPAQHGNGTKDVSMLKGGTWSGTQCTNTYCHSSGKGTYQNPGGTWAAGTAMTCNGCHGTSNTAGTPDYANAGAGVANANSHTKHTGAGTPTCVYCHSTTTTSGTTIASGSTVHTDNALTVVQGGGKTFGWVGGVGFKNCSNISCHYNGAAQWGATLNCSSCHAFPPATNAHAAHIQNSALLTTAYGNTEVASNGANYAFGCGNCHPINQSTYHANGAVDISLDPADGGALKSKNPVGANRTGTGGATVCSLIYCHSNGAGGVALTHMPSPAWNTPLTGNKCGYCHGNPPQYASVGAGVAGANSHYNATPNFMGKEGGHMITIHSDNIYDRVAGTGRLTANTTTDSSHGNNAVATTMSCNVCHSGIVSATTTTIDTYSMNGTASSFRCGACHTAVTTTKLQAGAIADKSLHVNGSANVVFEAALTMKSKAQLRDASKPATWTRNGTYGLTGSYDSAALNGTWNAGTKTCTTACHNAGSVAVTPTWGDTTVTCYSCHTSL